MLVRDVPGSTHGCLAGHGAQACPSRGSGDDAGDRRLSTLDCFNLASADFAQGRRRAASKGATAVPDHDDGDLSSSYGWPTARSRRSTVFVVQRENHVAGQPSQFPDLAYRQPAEAGSATSEYFAPPARYDHWTQCQRQDGRSRWTCHYVPPEGNGPQLMFNDDDWPSLLVQVLGLPFIGRAADDGYKVVEGQRLPCLLFGHTTTACFFPDGLIGYYSGSRPAWPVTVRLTSYSPHVSANAFLPPVKPLPWNYQAASTVSRPRITPTAVAAVDGYFWLAGTYPCVTGECSALLRGTEGASPGFESARLPLARTALSLRTAWTVTRFLPTRSIGPATAGRPGSECLTILVRGRRRRSLLCRLDALIRSSLAAVVPRAGAAKS